MIWDAADLNLIAAIAHLTGHFAGKYTYFVPSM
jgi:hypothetical protein